MTFAVSRNLISKNTLKDLKIVKPKPTPQPCWSSSETQTIIAASANDHYASVFCLLAATGMHISEAKYMEWADVDLEKGVLQIRQKMITDKEQWKPKSGDRRIVPLSPGLKALLADLPRRSRWVFTAPKSPSNPKDNRPFDERRVLTHLKAILKELKLPGHLHTFRHSFISHALTSGTPEAVVRQWVGHVDAGVLKLYTHIADRQSKEFMDRLYSDQSGKAPDAAGDRSADEAKQNDPTPPELEGGAEKPGDFQD